jgi:hypothetical protein
MNNSEFKLKMQGITETLTKAKETRFVMFAMYKESYIDDIEFLLRYTKELESQLKEKELQLTSLVTYAAGNK